MTVILGGTLESWNEHRLQGVDFYDVSLKSHPLIQHLLSTYYVRLLMWAILRAEQAHKAPALVNLQVRGG